jgi:hypothetical protein
MEKKADVYVIGPNGQRVKYPKHGQYNPDGSPRFKDGWRLAKDEPPEAPHADAPEMPRKADRHGRI